MHLYLAALADEILYITLNDVYAKGYRMPYWNRLSSTDESDNTVNNISSLYIVVAIMHNEILS